MKVVHYARDVDLQPACEEGRRGDWMTFFLHEVTCAGCKSYLSAPVTKDWR